MAEGFALDSQWKPVKIGAGGWITGIDIALDGTMVARTDTYGAYIWNGTQWQQLATVQSMPSTVFYTGSVYEVRISPSNSNIIYMQMSDGLYKTTDKGASWVKTSFPVVGETSGDYRMDGQKMAVDPNNPNIVFAGTQKAGLWVTRDGGTTWNKIDAVPQGTRTTDAGMTGIVVQGSDVFVGTAGSGVYHSKDGGKTWSAIGGPADISHAAIAKDGSYYATGNTDFALWKFANGSWTKLVDNLAHGVAINPFDQKHIVVTNEGGGVQQSLDGGATWSGWNHNSQLESSNDIPWLENSGLYMSAGRIVFDPLVEGKVWQSAGVGVWQTKIPEVLNWNTPVVWQSQSVGIEQLVSSEILAPAGGNPIFASWDRPFFEMADLDSYASTYSGGKFSMGWSIDYASTNSQFIVGISDWWGQDNSGFSTDGGKTWQKFSSLPSFAMNSVGGSIAAASPTNFVWVPAGGSAPAYTLDGGKSWQTVEIPGKTDWSMLHHSYYLNRTTITADRVLPNTFYLYDSNSGVFVTKDGGVTWTNVFDKPVTDWSYWNASIQSVPGSPGELFFTAGPQGTDQTVVPGMMSFMHSQDGGKSWQAISGVDVATFGFGAAKSAGGPATVYIVGSVNGDFGIWYSADDAKSWVKVGERPMGSMDGIKTISGDMDQFGVVYVGFGGSGFAYLNLNESAQAPASSAPPAPAPAPVQAPAPAPVTPPAPDQKAAISEALDDQGSSETVANGGLTNDSTPTLNGTLSGLLKAGQVVAIYRDGLKVGSVTTSSQAWSFTDAGTPEGAVSYSVRVEDDLGRAGTTSATFNLTVDSTAPNQLVKVTGAATASGTISLASFSMVSSSSSTGSTVSGTISSSLESGETLAIFRDGTLVGTATVSRGAWSFNDSVASGSFKYSAQVKDAAGNLGQMSDVFTASLGARLVSGTDRGDTLFGSSGGETISGIAEASLRLGRNTIDVLTGSGGADVFILGDARGRFYDDGNANRNGFSDYARITDFRSDDKLQLKGSAADYLQGWVKVGGFEGTGIYFDSNKNGVLDRNDELIVLVQNQGAISEGQLIFV